MWRSMLLVMFLLNQSVVYAETLVLGVYPYLNISEVLQRFDPLANYLSNALNVPVEISMSHDYSEHIELVGQDFLDIAYLGPVSYVNLLEKYAPKILLGRVEVKGNNKYRGAIIVRSNSPIHTLTDLKHKTFAFGDPKSTMSHIMPHYMLLRAGIYDHDLAGHDFLGNHESVALSVLLGQYDAGAVKASVARKYAKNNLRVLQWTPYVSEHVFVMRPSLDQETQDKIKQAFVEAGQPEYLPVLTSIKSTITGFEAAQASDYDNLREILATLRQANIIE
ncbi:phosphate/phosphite/phosphonate ABC transporter substrate-binding protein [Candidatus Albibeggiatoa sp. nov. NOAA]|uniref:phosphate/phosphite/phosphonate ABC transporter substrate-binding protein n=1 Tax=Candidatus Albibeggiatoa sp. nov. NOAA TaxID=3162724 RepID=UPI0032F663BB|nr:phosphate/phosphite/phosphonate ABC transporter substrate-binding protein [Thiotrichaceae bacterium]